MRPPFNLSVKTVSLLGGLCFFLSALEYIIPRPLPFLRIGLSNLPLLIALDILPFSSFMLLAGLKVAGQALVSGTLLSYAFLFSLGGTGVSALFMYALRRGLGKERISLIGTGAAGAFASNGTQLLLAWCFVFGESALYAAVPVLALGIVSGALLGAAAGYFGKRSLWYSRALSGASAGTPHPGEMPASVSAAGEGPGAGMTLRDDSRKAREAFFQKTFGSAELALAGLCMAPALLLNPDTNTRIAQFLFFLLLARLVGKRNNPLVTLAVMAGIVFFNLFVPYGELLFSAGPFAVTSGALWGGIRRAVTLEGLFMLSRVSVRKDLVLPGRFGKIAGEAFRVFSVMAGEKHLFGPRNWVSRLDGLLLRLEGGTETGEAPALSRPEGRDIKALNPIKKRGVKGKIILASALLLAWLPLIIDLFNNFSY